MTVRWEESGWRARGLSTRPVQVAGEDHVTRFTREALDGLVQQIREGFVSITIEHLDYLPPIGRWHDAKIIEARDGESELEMYGRPLQQLIPAAEDPRDPLDAVSSLPEESAPSEVELTLRFEARNFDVADLGDIEASSPFPTREEHRWSELPPLIWTLCIPVVWGACKFGGSFLETLGKESAEALTQWLRRTWNRAKDPARDRILSLQFELGDGVFVHGFIPSRHDVAANDDMMVRALREADLLAAFAGLQKEEAVLEDLKRAAFIFSQEGWRLAWWTDGVAVYRTRWFEDNMPDPTRILGRPVIDEPTPED